MWKVSPLVGCGWTQFKAARSVGIFQTVSPNFCSSGVAVYKLRQFFGGVHWISSSSECSDALSLPLSVGNDWSDAETSRIGSGFGGIMTGTAAADMTGGVRFCAGTGTMRRRVLVVSLVLLVPPDRLHALVCSKAWYLRDHSYQIVEVFLCRTHPFSGMSRHEL